jgi:hypothetical protein
LVTSVVGYHRIAAPVAPAIVQPRALLIAGDLPGLSLKSTLARGKAVGASHFQRAWASAISS